MCTEFGIYVVRTSSSFLGGNLFRTRIKSGEGVQCPFDFTQTFDNPSDSNGNARKKSNVQLLRFSITCEL